MRDCPNVEQLLAAARETLLQDLLPAIPARLRHELLMVANALAIATRSVAAGDAPLMREWSALQGLYKREDAAPRSGAELDACLRELNRRLAEDIRAGRFDGHDAERDAVRRLLEAGVHDKLSENRPKFLQQHDDDGRTAAERDGDARTLAPASEEHR